MNKWCFVNRSIKADDTQMVQLGFMIMRNLIKFTVTSLDVQVKTILEEYSIMTFNQVRQRANKHKSLIIHVELFERFQLKLPSVRFVLSLGYCLQVMWKDFDFSNILFWLFSRLMIVWHFYQNHPEKKIITEKILTHKTNSCFKRPRDVLQ